MYRQYILQHHHLQILARLDLQNLHHHICFLYFQGLNEQHPHAWDFQDAPLVYKAFLGNQIKQDGVQLKWIAPTELLLSRDLTYNEADALAKQDETAALHKAMQSDIVQQVMRRLAAVRAEQLAVPADAVQAPALASSTPR